MFNNSTKGGRRRQQQQQEKSAADDDEVRWSRRPGRLPLLPTPTSHVAAALACFLLVALSVVHFQRNLPEPLTVQDAPHQPGRFVAERAMRFLAALTGVGPRPTGSHENEEVAVGLLLGEIADISRRADPVHEVVVDVQKVSGAFPLHFLDGMTNVYRNVKNVVVKLAPRQNKSPHSVLMNCHFDTVPDSPGGSDDGASCAIMLEILIVITQRNVPLKHNVIFLFNGAEENFMQASHGFITQHKWAKEVRAFVNLEACGAGGREVLFQAGPNHPWIIQKYSEVAPYPYASSLAQEIFQSGIIPGDTDFRIFRDFGHISGLDFAWASNGYVYHSNYDGVEQIPLGTLQRTGDNMLALMAALADSDELAHVELHADGNLIFFDILGAFVIRWSELFNKFINIAVIVTSVFTIRRNVHQARVQHDVPENVYLKQLGLTTTGIVLGCWVGTVVVCAVVALLMTSIGCAMSWFARPYWIFFLYICPALSFPMALVYSTSRNQLKMFKSPWTVFQLYYDGYTLAWTLVLLVSTVFSIRSGFVALLWVSFSCVGTLLQQALFRHWRDWKWLLLHSGVLLAPFTQSFYLILGAMNLYVPIMGRIGSTINGEVLVGVITSAMFVLLFSFLVPLILLVKSPKTVLCFLGSLFLFAVAVISLTPLGFPYSGDPQNLAPQRHMLAHAERILHDVEGKVRKRESGYWMVDMDLNSPWSVQDAVPGVADARNMGPECAEELYCGVPYLIPVTTFIWQTHWIAGPPPHIPIPTTLTLNSNREITSERRRMEFTVTGPDHMGVIVSPGPGLNLDRWSLVEGEPLAGPKWKGRSTYFVFYSYTVDPEPFTFWIELTGRGRKNETLDVAVISHFMHGPHKTTPEFRQFMGHFPKWTTLSGWVATYASWKF